LPYVVYVYQKSFNFINAFACYNKQKYKLALFNLAHPMFLKKTGPLQLISQRYQFTTFSNYFWQTEILFNSPLTAIKSF